jgi:hypothetical protein
MKAVYQIKIKLANIAPTIWRSILIPTSSTLFDLHQAIQSAMHWKNKHHYMFEYDGAQYDGEAGQSILLTELKLSPQNRLTYLYDLDNHWEHHLLIEEILPAKANQTYPLCIAGARAAPPEGIDGVCGYESMLETLDDADGEAYEDLLEQIGEDFDPDIFDIKAANRRLSSQQEALA